MQTTADSLRDVTEVCSTEIRGTNPDCFCAAVLQREKPVKWEASRGPDAGSPTQPNLMPSEGGFFCGKSFEIYNFEEPRSVFRG